MKAYIDDVALDVYDYKYDFIINKPTGNKLAKIEISFNVIGLENKNQIESITKNKSFKLVINEKDIDIRVKRDNCSCSFSGTNEDEFTKDKYTLYLCELDKDLPEKWDYVDKIRLQVFDNYFNINTIKQLLIDKNIITKEEYNNKLKDIIEKDSEDFINYICYGLNKKGF